jgi:catechol 2,3-dioxygenase-like lactoylglutathione lyase family enzyme
VLSRVIAISIVGVLTLPQRAPAAEVLAPGNFIHVVADLNRTIDFYQGVLGLERANAAAGAPRFAANPAVARLYSVPEDTLIGVTIFRLPERGVALEFAQFGHGGHRAPRLHAQDPGTAVLVLVVHDLDGLRRKLSAAHVPVISAGDAAASDAAQGTRELVVTDPDGYLVELVERTAGAGNATSGNVRQAGLMLSVSNTDRTVQFYRELLGMPMSVQASFVTDRALSRALGIRGGQLRHSTVTLPGTDFRYDFVEWRGVVRHPSTTGIHDEGVGVLRLVVANVDSLVARLQADGVPIASAGKCPIALNAAFHTCILADPNGLFIEPVPRLPPGRPTAQSAASR